MADANFTLLTTIVVTIITILLTVVGIQLILVLRDLRRVLKHIDVVASELEKIGTSFGSGYSEIVGFLSSLKSVFYVVDLLSKKRRKQKLHEKK